MELKITYVKPIQKTESYLVDGLLLENRDVNSYGLRTRSALWVPFNTGIILDKTSINKVLEYFCNEKGRIVIARLKQ